MASPLVWKVYNGSGEHVASTKFAEDAAAVVGIQADGAKVKADGRVVWHEGNEPFVACDFIDSAADVMITRRREHAEERYAMLRAAQDNYARGIS